MELTYKVNVECDRRGNPNTAYIAFQQDDGQLCWIADTEFGPFDTWIDLLHWVRRSMSLDLDGRFT